jgi:3-dehydroquinate synthase
MRLYGRAPLNSGHGARLFEFMGHDKKNEAGRINFTLLSAPGHFEIDQHCSTKEITASLDYLCTL